MAKNGKEGAGVSEKTVTGPRARSIAIAQSGVKTSRDFAAMMSALMSDILDERIEPRAANAVCNAGGKLLKMVELEHKYGSPKQSGPERTLQLSS